MNVKSGAPGIMLLATTISFGNEWYQSAAHGSEGSDALPNLRIPIAGGLFTLFVAGLAELNEPLAKGLSTIVLITVLLSPISGGDWKGDSPLGTLAKLEISKPQGRKTHGSSKH